MDTIKKIFIGAAIFFTVALAGLAWFYSHSLYAARNWGGSVSLSVPAGGEHISTAWKGNELWTETYYPIDNKCVFKQESQYGLIEGSITISPCNYRSSK